MKSMPDTLEKCRAEIDVIDDSLIDLLSQRFHVVDRVIVLKQRDNLPAAVPQRIEEVVSRVLRRAESRHLPVAALEKLWRLLIDETIAYERQAKVK
jgi:isochorismate pyruvate lyase